MAHEILAPTTSGGTSEEFIVSQKRTGQDGYKGDNFPVQVTASGLDSAEEAHLEIKSGSTWMDVQDTAGNVAVLSAAGQSGATTIEIYAPGVYRVVQGATASASGVYLHTPSNP